MRLFIVLSMFLAGCASTRSGLITEDSSALQELAYSARKTEAEMTKLSNIISAKQQATISLKKRKQLHYNLMAIPKNFERKVNFNFIGSDLKAAQRIAKLASYQLQILGKVPKEPFIVNLKFKHASLNRILRAYSSQLSNSVDIQLFGRSKVMKLIYRKSIWCALQLFFYLHFLSTFMLWI